MSQTILLNCFTSDGYSYSPRDDKSFVVSIGVLAPILGIDSSNSLFSSAYKGLARTTNDEHVYRKYEDHTVESHT